MRLGVERVAHGRERFEQGRRLAVLEQGPGVSAGDSLRQSRDIGVEPDCDAFLEDQRPRARVDEGAAAGRNHLGRAADQPGDHAPFAVSEARLAEPFEHLGDIMLGDPLDLLVGIDEGEAEALGQPPAHGRLAGPHQADQDDAAIAAGERTGHVRRGLYSGPGRGAKGAACADPMLPRGAASRRFR